MLAGKEKNMSDNGRDDRRWPRLAVQVSAEVRIKGVPYVGVVNDLSVGGTSMRLTPGERDGKEVEVSIDDFGEFEGAIVRRWEDGLALEFNLEEDDQFSLEEDLEAFRRENDLE